MPSSPHFQNRIDFGHIWQKLVEERHWLLVAVPLALCMVGPIRWLSDLWNPSSDTQGYQPLVPLGIGYLVWADRESIASAYHSLAGVYDEENKRRRGTTLVAYVGCVVLLLSYFLALPTVAIIGFLITVLGAVLHVYGFTVLRTLWRPALFSLLMIPYPSVIENMMLSWLQRGCTFVAGQILHIFHPTTIAQGNLISIGLYNTQITGSSTGVGVLLRVLALTFFLVLLRRMRWITASILLVCSAGIAVLTNIARLVIMGLIGVHNATVADILHDANAWFFAAIAFGLTYLLAGKIGPRVSTANYDYDDSYLDDDDEEEDEE